MDLLSLALSLSLPMNESKLTDAYPLFRIARSGDETRFQLLPGYPGFNIRL